MGYLYQALAEKAREWRESGCPCVQHPAIGEILDYQTDAETGSSRYLRKPQLHALEIYWYLRLVENAPHIFATYFRRLLERRVQTVQAGGAAQVGHYEDPR